MTSGICGLHFPSQYITQHCCRQNSLAEFPVKQCRIYYEIDRVLSKPRVLKHFHEIGKVNNWMIVINIVCFSIRSTIEEDVAIFLVGSSRVQIVVALFSSDTISVASSAESSSKMMISTFIQVCGGNETVLGPWHERHCRVNLPRVPWRQKFLRRSWYSFYSAERSPLASMWTIHVPQV